MSLLKARHYASAAAGTTRKAARAARKATGAAGEATRGSRETAGAAGYVSAGVVTTRTTGETATGNARCSRRKTGQSHFRTAAILGTQHQLGR